MISPFHSRPQRSQHTIDTKEISRRILVNGTEHVLSHGGTSQYNRDGTGASACGLAALNFARIAFSIEQSGLYDMDLLQAVLARECAEVRRLYTIIPLFDDIHLSKGNHWYMCIMVWKPSSRSRRYLSHPLV
jgi:hypothetical protein